MPGISLSGLASGLDTESLVTGLMSIERQPRIRLELKQGQVQARQAALNDILSKLKSLKTAAADLRSVALWADTQSVETSDATKIAAKRVSGTGPGGYQLEVSQLARAEQRTYSFAQSAAPTQITIGAATVDLAADATLADAVAAINSNPDTGVYAVDVGGSLVLSSRQTGAANGFTATGSGIAETASKAGLDAQYLIDGVAGSSASNVVTSAIPGLEVTLKGVTTSAVTVTVGAPGADTTAVKAKVKAFVELYNQTVDLVRAKIGEKKVPNPASQADANKGVLAGDGMLNGVLAQMRQALSDTVAGSAATLDELAEIGISTGAASAGVTSASSSVLGKLVFNESKFDSAIASDSLGVRRLLGGVTGTDGFAQRFEAVLESATGAAGSFQGRLDAATGQLDRIRDQMSALDLRLEAKEARYRAQFATLETLLGQSQSQQAWLTGQLNGLNAG